ncbi:hypothetical protein [Apibacter adventoris]|uniref:hypothetical protein n=1 Tax=Apibacter adventoris TaxID=1679466 RepID=UPI000CF6CFAC|nr:hypothetical protein [Apibacter adventoris]PQL95212.1 hypothetical protein C4S76_03225 [Apibacter adventoris]
MNKLEYNNAGGFPMTTNRLEDIQETYTLPINGLAAMAGDLAIISGCYESGNNIITDGFIFINGEIFEFRGGIKLANITLFEEKVVKEFENGTQKVVITKRYFTFGTGAQNYKWENFKRIPPLTELLVFMKETREELKILKAQNAPINQGDGIIFFDNIAALIPPGYNEVPENEWRGRMLIHINRSVSEFSKVGNYGRSCTHINTIEEMAPHSHNGHVREDTGTWKGGGYDSTPNSTSNYGNTSSEGSGKVQYHESLSSCSLY